MTITSRVTGSIVDMAAHLLPIQERRRYAEEFRADLSSRVGWRQWAYAVSALCAAPRLRWVLLTSLAGHAAPLCYVGLHHNRTFRPNPEDASIKARECLRCHRVRDPKQYGGRSRHTEMEWAPAAFYR